MDAYYGITVEGSFVFLGWYGADESGADKAESDAADYGRSDACGECGHGPTDIIYYGSRKHFIEMMDKLAK